MPSKKTPQSVTPEMVTVALRLVWVGADEADITFVNSIAVQPQGDEVIILFGQQAPPLLLGTPAEMAEQAKGLTHVPVRTRLRIGTTRQRLAEFAEVLQRATVLMGHQADALRLSAQAALPEGQTAALPRARRRTKQQQPAKRKR